MDGVKPYVLVVAISLVFALASTLDAGYIPQSIGLHESLKRSDVVLLCEIAKVIPDRNQVPSAFDFPTTGPITDPRAIVALTSLQPPSQYVFKVVASLRGNVQGEIDLHLPLVSGFYYGQAKFAVEPGMYCLLLLSKKGSTAWSAADEYVPIIPLGKKVEVPRQAVVDVESTVVELMLASIADREMLRANAYLLRQTLNADIPKKLKAFAADRDIDIKQSVLLCLAFNQDVDAIPLIVALEKETKTGTSSIGGLASYRTAAAVPLLNPVIVDGPEYARLNAMRALRQIADKSSIPFLMKALEKDDRQHIVSYDAYFTLHRLIGPSVGPAGTGAHFLAHRDVEVQILKNWWAQQPESKPASTQPN